MPEVMTDVDLIVKNASASATAIDTLVALVERYDTAYSNLQASHSAMKKEAAALKQEADTLRKQASAEQPTVVEIKEELLNKTAAAIYALYGSPANSSVDTLKEAFRNPNCALNALHKLAAKMTSQAVSGGDLGTQVNGSDATEVKKVPVKSSYRQSFNEIWKKK